ncbi:MAG: methyl-accepting chemotaxis protein [Nitrospirota bacterium]
MRLKTKSALIVSIILCVVFTANTIVLTVTATNRYRAVLLSRTMNIAEELQKDISTALKLGTPLELLERVDERLAAICSTEKDIAFAMVINTNKEILFRGGSEAGSKQIEGQFGNRAISTKTPLSEKVGAYYNVVAPIFGENKQIEGAIILGLKAQAINRETYSLLKNAIIVGVVCFFAAIFLLYIFISRFFATPIINIQSVAETTSQGDLTHTVSVKSNDELASLGMAINRMTQNLKDMLTKVSSVTDRVTAVTEKIALSSSEVSTGANTQRDAIGKTAVAIEDIDNSISSIATGAESLSASAEATSSAIIQMSASVEKIAESANDFSDTAAEAAASVEEMVSSIKDISQSLELLSASAEETALSLTEINTTVKEVEKHASESVNLAQSVTSEASNKGMNAANAAINGMKDIKESMDAISKVINTLSEGSKQIGLMVNVIDEVADKTSLLALNAAILAAQAGEHGKSFAVVADEIKSLAERTSSSTKEIADTVASIQGQTEASVKLAATGINSVEKGVDFVKEVTKALESILGSAKSASNMATFIQKAAVEQTKAVSQITDAVKKNTQQITHISTATKEQSKESRLIAESIERIKKLAQHVKSATYEQSGGSKQISQSIVNVSHQTEQIAKATSGQREQSKEIINSIESIKKIANESVNLANEMNSSIKSLEVEAETLMSELKRFKV